MAQETIDFSGVIEKISMILSDRTGEELTELYNREFAEPGESLSYTEDGEFLVMKQGVPPLPPEILAATSLGRYHDYVLWSKGNGHTPRSFKDFVAWEAESGQWNVFRVPDEKSQEEPERWDGMS